MWDPSFSPSCYLSSALPPVKERTYVTLINIDKRFHEMSSRMENEQGLGEKLRARWRVRQNANASITKGITCQGKAKKQILCTSVFHSSLKSLLFFALLLSPLLRLYHSTLPSVFPGLFVLLNLLHDST